MKVNRKAVRKILVLRYRSIGDILLANPSLKALRENFPEASIDIVVDDLFEPVLYNNPNIDKIVRHRRKLRDSGLFSEIGFIKRLRRGNYDLVVDLHGGPRSAYASFFSGAQYRVGHHFKLRNKLCYNIKAEPSTQDDHTWRVQYKIVRPLGIEWPTQDPVFHLDFPDEQKDSMNARLETAGLMFDRPLVLLHPGARVPIKRWPSTKMGQLARWLVDEKSCAVILAGTKADADEIEIIRKASGYALPHFTDLSIGELAALIKKSGLVVCNDSGPMHMAGVLNVPTVSLFGPSDPTIWGPCGNDNVSVLCSPPMECMPCDQRGCQYEGDNCMDKIELAKVKQAVAKLKAIP